jgi:septal ring factor EnvC (AmiA/AmiB activator)
LNKTFNRVEHTTLYLANTLDIQPQDIQATSSATSALDYLVRSLEKRLTSIEAAQASSQDKLIDNNSQLIKLNFLLQQLQVEFEEQEKTAAERARESRQLIQNVKAGVILFAATSTLCALAAIVFPRLMSEHRPPAQLSAKK